MRDGFVFYASWLEAIKNLPREIQGEVLTAIIEYGLYGETTETPKPITKAMLALVKPQIDVNNMRYENGKKGGRPAKSEINECQEDKATNITKPKPNNNQTITKPKPKDKDKDKDKEYPHPPKSSLSEDLEIDDEEEDVALSLSEQDISTPSSRQMEKQSKAKLDEEAEERANELVAVLAGLGASTDDTEELLRLSNGGSTDSPIWMVIERVQDSNGRYSVIDIIHTMAAYEKQGLIKCKSSQQAMLEKELSSLVSHDEYRIITSRLTDKRRMQACVRAIKQVSAKNSRILMPGKFIISEIDKNG